MKKSTNYIISIILLILLLMGFSHYLNSSIEKIANKEGSIKLLEQIDTGDSTLVIYDTGDYIKAGEFKRGILGWRVITGSSPAINDRNYETTFRVDNISYINTYNSGYWYGYVNQNKVDTIVFENDKFKVQYKVDSYYWYIPDLSAEGEEGTFNAKQFSIVLKDGTKVYYPFEELQ